MQISKRRVRLPSLSVRSADDQREGEQRKQTTEIGIAALVSDDWALYAVGWLIAGAG